MLEEVQLGRLVGRSRAQMDALERRNRADYEEQQRNSFENMVYQKLEALQNQLDAMTVTHEEKEKRKTFEADVNRRLDEIAWQVDLKALTLETELQSTVTSIHSKMSELFEEEREMEVSMCKLVHAELMDREKTIVKQFEQRLKVHEEQSIKRFEEYSRKTAQMLEKLVGKQFEDLQSELEAVSCHVRRLEYKMETEMRQLFHGMYKAQGNLHGSDSDDDGVEHKFFMDEFPGYIDESIEEEAKNGNSKEKCDTPSRMPLIDEKNEQSLCEDIIASRDDYMSSELAHEQTRDREGMREWDHTACAPIQEREHSIGAEFPSHQEDNSLPPTILPRFSCELACSPQVKACFGVLASSTSREESQGKSSWEDKDTSVDCELQKRHGKKKRQSVAQVWIPRGTLEVMRVFDLTEISLGEKSCVPYKAKKRRRRRKASNPQSGIG